MQLLKLDTQVGTELCIQIRERLVEKEDVHVAHKGAPDGDSLALAARKRRRLPLEKRLYLKDIGSACHAFLDLALRHAGVLEAERHVSFDGHLRVQRVALENHADAAFRRFGPSDVAPLDEDLAAGDVEQTRDAIEKRGLPAARRAQKDQELAFVDRQVQALQYVDRPEAEVEIPDFDGCRPVPAHGFTPSPRRLQCP